MATENFALPCPQSDNMAALALYMEGLALQLDDDLSGLQDGLNAGLNRPTAIWQQSGNITLGGGTLLGVTFDTLVYSNYPDARNNSGSFFPQLPAHVPGWWRIGFYARVSQAAAIVANTSRAISMQVRAGDPFNFDLGSFSSPTYRAQTIESNTGNESLLLEETVLLPDFPVVVGSSGSNAQIFMTFFVDTGGGGNVSLLGGMICWATFITQGDQVEVTS